MSGSKRYVLDANVFIEAKNKYYGFNLCPGLWKALIAEHDSKRIFSIDKVRDELVRVSHKPDDEVDLLSDWARNKVPETFFQETQDQAIINVFQNFVTWVNSEPQFTPAAKAEFASAADAWLIAYAEVYGLIVVTHEEYKPDAKKTVPMPNICLEFNVDYVNTFEILEDLRVKFILSTKRQRPK